PVRSEGTFRSGTVANIVDDEASPSGLELSTLETLTITLPRLPAASWALTITRFVPGWSGMGPALHVDVPLAVPLCPVSVVQATATTPTLSTAVPPMVIRSEAVVKVDPVAGVVTVTVGAWASTYVTVTVRDP